MTINLNQFSDLLGARSLRDTDTLAVTDRDNLKLRNSRFPMLRWIVNSGIGKRATNRKTVDTFLRAMENQFGAQLLEKMQLDSLRELQRRGKPLHVRHVRSSVEQATRLQGDAAAVVDELERQFGKAPYAALPGGRELTQAVRDHIDFDSLFRNLQADCDNYRGREQIWAALPSMVERLATTAHNEAVRKIFLGGYGIRQGAADTTNRLQAMVEELPETGKLSADFGLSFDTSRMPPAFFEKLSGKLQKTVERAMARPEHLATGDNADSIMTRVQQAVRLTAETTVRQYLQQRLEALQALRQAQSGDLAASAGAATAAAAADGLYEQALYNRIPASQAPRLLALREEMPQDLGALATADRDLNAKFQLLHQFGALVLRIITDMTPEEQQTYASGPDDSVDFMEECSNFLKYGKLDDAAAAQLRQALGAGAGSELTDLYQTLQDIKYAAECNADDASPKADPVWGEAYRAVEQVDAAFKQLPGYPELAGAIDMADDRPYAQAALPVYQAMRNCGITLPPPAGAPDA